MRLLNYAKNVLFVSALPLVLILSSVRWAVLDLNTYQQGYANYQISRTTGLSEVELEAAARQLINYLSGGKPVSLQVRKVGVLTPIYNERESLHLIDVRDLFQLAFRVQELGGLGIIGFVALSFAMRPRAFLRPFSKLLLAGSVFTLVLFGTVYAIASWDFDNLFLSFHLVSFTNDLWKLDASTDYLVRMFPQGFWFDATLVIVTRSLTAAFVLMLAGLIIFVATSRGPKVPSLPRADAASISQ